MIRTRSTRVWGGTLALRTHVRKALRREAKPKTPDKKNLSPLIPKPETKLIYSEQRGHAHGQASSVFDGSRSKCVGFRAPG